MALELLQGPQQHLQPPQAHAVPRHLHLLAQRRQADGQGVAVVGRQRTVELHGQLRLEPLRASEALLGG